MLQSLKLLNSNMMSKGNSTPVLKIRYKITFREQGRKL
jgi:hypothetical protein